MWLTILFGVICATEAKQHMFVYSTPPIQDQWVHGNQFENVVLSMGPNIRRVLSAASRDTYQF